MLIAGKLESAREVMKSRGISRTKLDCGKAVEAIETQIREKSGGDDVRNLERLKRRRLALGLFRNSGLAPREMIPEHNLRADYRGKVLLIHISGGLAHGLVCIRGGDDWHREILANTREEILDLGFDKAEAAPAGGAVVQFEPDGIVIIYGNSEEFGTCDKNRAAELIQAAFPEHRIFIRP